MRVTRVLHVSLNATGTLDETREFYQGLFCLADATRPDIPGVPGHWFAVGDAQLHLVGAPPVGDGRADPTGPHYCVAVDDIEAAVAELEQRGIDYRTAWQGDVRQVWLRDPTGATVELQQDRSL